MVLTTLSHSEFHILKKIFLYPESIVNQFCWVLSCSSSLGKGEKYSLYPFSLPHVCFINFYLVPLQCFPPLLTQKFPFHHFLIE